MMTKVVTSVKFNLSLDLINVLKMGISVLAKRIVLYEVENLKERGKVPKLEICGCCGSLYHIPH